jgi:hypothetical protein
VANPHAGFLIFNLVSSSNFRSAIQFLSNQDSAPPLTAVSHMQLVLDAEFLECQRKCQPLQSRELQLVQDAEYL